MTTDTATCDVCGFEAKGAFGLQAHKRGAHPEPVIEPVLVAEAPVAAATSIRGQRRRRRDQQMLSPLEQIRGRPVGDENSRFNGAWAYYINPEGATIRDALILYPNGAQLPRNEDTKGRYSENAAYYQARQARKGLKYVGPTLTEPGVRLLVQTLQANKEDEILDLNEQIAECENDIKNSDRPEVRDNQRKRRAQLQRRLAHVEAPLDADELISELNSIARAQRMARVSPEVMIVMREMLGELDEKYSGMFQEAFAKFAVGPQPSEEVTGVSNNG